MLIADVDHEGRIRTLRDEIAFPRLGKGVDLSRMISTETLERVHRTLKNFKRISEELRSDKIVACGTSALRDAKNRDDWIRLIKEDLGIGIEVLSGEDEALWSFFGAVSEFEGDRHRFAVIDIGGGSTEVTVGTRSKLQLRESLDIGCVRLTERILRSSPPEVEQLEEASNAVRESIKSLNPLDSQECDLVGVAGTVTTLAALDQNLEEFDVKKIDGHVLFLDRITSLYEKMRRQTLDEIASSPIIPAGRADVLVAGILILLEFMSYFGFKRIRVSGRGLRYGLVLREYERMRKASGTA